MVDFIYRRKAYKAARDKVRAEMHSRKLSRAEIMEIAVTTINSDFPGVCVDIYDLIGACIFYQQKLARCPD